jgi:hypothetical protein
VSHVVVVAPHADVVVFSVVVIVVRVDVVVNVSVYD